MSKDNEKFYTMLNEIRKDVNNNHTEVVVSIARIEAKMESFSEKLNNNEQDIKHNKQETDDLKENYLLTKQKVGMIATVLGLAGGIIVSIAKSFFGI